MKLSLRWSVLPRKQDLKDTKIKFKTMKNYLLEMIVFKIFKKYHKTQYISVHDDHATELNSIHRTNKGWLIRGTIHNSLKEEKHKSEHREPNSCKSYTEWVDTWVCKTLRTGACIMNDLNTLLGNIQHGSENCE